MAQTPVSQMHVILRLPGTDAVSIASDIPYGTKPAGDLRMDVYRPAGSAPGDALPAVVFVTGYSDAGARELFGNEFKDWAAYTDWAKLVAGTGLIAITYTNEEPVRDARALLAHIRDNADTLGIDAGRIGLWACSGNVPNAIALLGGDPTIACAALCYGYTIDAPGCDDVARAARQFGFANSATGAGIDHLKTAPLLLVRAGRDEMPGLNASLDRFIASAADAGLPLTVIDVPDAPHAFDVTHDSHASRSAINQILEFLREALHASDRDA